MVGTSKLKIAQPVSVVDLETSSLNLPSGIRRTKTGENSSLNDLEFRQRLAEKESQEAAERRRKMSDLPPLPAYMVGKHEKRRKEPRMKRVRKSRPKDLSGLEENVIEKGPISELLVLFNHVNRDLHHKAEKEVAAVGMSANLTDRHRKAVVELQRHCSNHLDAPNKNPPQILPSQNVFAGESLTGENFDRLGFSDC